MDETLLAGPNGMPTTKTHSLGATRELLQALSDEEWGNTATPPLALPWKNLELQLGSQQTIIDTLHLSDKSEEGIIIEGNKTVFLKTLDQ